MIPYDPGCPASQRPDKNALDTLSIINLHLEIIIMACRLAKKAIVIIQSELEKLKVGSRSFPLVRRAYLTSLCTSQFSSII